MYTFLSLKNTEQKTGDEDKVSVLLILSTE